MTARPVGGVVFPVRWVAVVMAAGMAGASAGEPARVLRTPAPRVFTAEQARAGRLAYESSCGLCHRSSLQGRTGAPGELPDVNTLPANMIKTLDDSAGQVPALVGPRFLARWGEKTAKAYIQRVANAVQGFPPKDNAADTAVLLTAYFLQANGGQPGDTPLTADTGDTLNAVVAGRVD
jgi:mono/diheme cytochrome c family protein